MELEQLITHYGILAVFFGAGIEGETTVVLGGIAADRSLLSYSRVVTAAVLGSFTADQFLFALGRYAEGIPAVRHLTSTRAMKEVATVLERHPNLFVLGFRFIYGVRIVSPVAIGLSHITAARFCTLNAIAALVWGFAFTTVGYLFGHAVERLYGRMELHLHLLCGLTTACAATLTLALLARRHLRTTTNKVKV